MGVRRPAEVSRPMSSWGSVGQWAAGVSGPMSSWGQWANEQLGVRRPAEYRRPAEISRPISSWGQCNWRSVGLWAAEVRFTNLHVIFVHVIFWGHYFLGGIIFFLWKYNFGENIFLGKGRRIWKEGRFGRKKGGFGKKTSGKFRGPSVLVIRQVIWDKLKLIFWRHVIWGRQKTDI